MGIPSYFSYIIRNYPKIVKSLQTMSAAKPNPESGCDKSNEEILNHLFLDSNSIIYDSVYKFTDSIPTDDDIIESVLSKINDYIMNVAPKQTVFIAFDGVAPFAKMKQQRKRRYKTQFVSNIFSTTQKKWDTLKITPGTEFMKELSRRVTEYFVGSELKYSVDNVIVSTSNEPGEGEHKIFKYIRENNFINDNVIIYGLDSDLFMLSIFNHKYYKNAYIFREAPEFLKSKINLYISNESGKKTDMKEDETFLVDIGLLSKYILVEMGFTDPNRIYDYVFLCFFLGNDFLPQFPAFNIRSHGIRVFMDVYNKLFSKKTESFLLKYEISNNRFEICWKNVQLLIRNMSKLEHQYLLEEYSLREKFDKWIWHEPKTEEDREKMFQNSPIMNRAGERYICPSEEGWENRYNELLLEGLDREEISKNYLEGLEWCMLYYTEECPDWRWSYMYKYGPLFVDLLRGTMVETSDPSLLYKSEKTSDKHKPMSQEEQLEYVIPKNDTEKKEFVWHFKRYLWESE